MPYRQDEIIGIQQQRKLAERLRNQADAPIQAGNAPMSWTQGLSKMLASYGANKKETSANERMNAYEIERRNKMAELLGQDRIDPTAASEYSPEFGLEAYKMNQSRQMEIEKAERAAIAKEAARRQAIEDKKGLIDYQIEQSSNEPLPASVLKEKVAITGDIESAKNMNKRLLDISSKIAPADGSPPVLELGLWKNMMSEAKNFVGASDPRSREYAQMRSTMEKMRNDSLRLNKGMQTEGDAQRAWDELITNFNDPKVVQAQLDRISKINEDAIKERQTQIGVIEQNYGRAAPQFGGADQTNVIDFGTL